MLPEVQEGNGDKLSEKEHPLLPYSEIKMKNLPDLPADLTSRMESYADLMVVNPHLDRIEAYMKVYKCSRVSAAKNFRRVYDRPEFKEYVKVMKAAVSEHLGITEEQLIHILSMRVKTKITDVVKWDKNGNVEYIPSDQLDEGAALAINKFELTERPILDSTGQPIYDGSRLLADRKIKVELKNPDKPLELLMRHLNLLDKEDPQTARREAQLYKFLSMVHDKPSEKQ